MNTESVTSKHLTPGDTLLVGRLHPWGDNTTSRFPRNHPSYSPEQLTVVSVERIGRTTILVHLSDGTHVNCANATRVRRVVA